MADIKAIAAELVALTVQEVIELKNVKVLDGIVEKIQGYMVNEDS